MQSLGTLVPPGHDLVVYFMQKGIGLMRSSTWCGFLLVQSYRHKDTAHTGANRLAHQYKYILTPTVMCKHQLSVLQWMNNLLISNLFYSVPQCLSFIKIPNSWK